MDVSNLVIRMQRTGCCGNMDARILVSGWDAVVSWMLLASCLSGCKEMYAVVDAKDECCGNMDVSILVIRIHRNGCGGIMDASS